MADQTDGSIIIDTKINSDGFKAGSAELLTAIKALSTEVKNLGQTLKNLFNKPLTPEINTDNAEEKVAGLEAKVRELQSSLDALQNAKGGGNASTAETATPQVNVGGATEKASDLQRKIDAVNNSVQKLEPIFSKAMSGSEGAMTSFDTKVGVLKSTIAKLQQQLDTVGQTQFPTQQYQDAVKLLDKVNYKADILRERMQTLDARGVSHNSQQWKNLQADIDLATQKSDKYAATIRKMEADGSAFQLGADTAQYAQMNAALAAASSKLSEMESKTQKSDSFMRRLASASKNAAKNIAGTLVSGIKTAASGIAKMLSHGKNMNKQFGGMISGAKKFAVSLLGARGAYALLQKAVSAYMAENQQLSNTLSACWSGIGNLLGPIITRIINLVAQATAYVTNFLQLFGKSTTKAIGSAGSTASKATDKLKRQLASFDDLNVIGDNSSTESGGSDIGTATGDIPDWARLMVDQIKGGDWAAVAKTLTGQLNNMIAGADWADVGDKIGYYLNGAMTFIATSIRTFDWYNLGVDLATGANHIIDSVDWTNLGTILGAKFTVLIGGLDGIFATIDWVALGEALADAFMGLWDSIDWVQAAKTLSDGVIGALNGLSTAIKNVDWQKLGQDVATFIAGIDWAGVTESLFDGLGAALGGIAAFLWGLIEDAWNSVVDWWNDTAYEDGEFTMAGLLDGIWNGIKDIGTWIYNHIFKPFIDGFKSVFGIASPSTVMSEQGDFIVQGLLEGITNVWHTITDFFSGALDGIKNTIATAWDGIKTGAATAWDGIKSTLSTAWDGIKTTASTTWDNLKTTASTTWDSIKTTASTKWSTIKTSLSTAWNGIKTTASTKWNSLKTTISTGWNKIKTNTSSTWDTVKRNLSSKWESIKSTASTKWNDIKSTIKNKGWSDVGDDICNGISKGIDSGWSWLKEKAESVAGSLLDKAKSALGIHSPSRLFRDEVGLNIGYGIGEGLEASQPSVLKSVSGVADAIADEFNAGDYKVGNIVPTSEVDGALSSFSDKISGSFSSLLDRLQAIADNITFAVPTVAGGVVPYKTAAAAASGGGADIGTTIETSNDALASVVTQVVTNATAAIVTAIQNYSGTTVNLDKTAIAESTIREINRRTRATGKSPLE